MDAFCPSFSSLCRAQMLLTAQLLLTYDNVQTLTTGQATDVLTKCKGAYWPIGPPTHRTPSQPKRPNPSSGPD